MSKENERLPEKYPEVMNSGIEVRMWYCEQHKEYFSNNCSECMLLANDPDTIIKTRQATLREVGELFAVKVYQALMEQLCDCECKYADMECGECWVEDAISRAVGGFEAKLKEGKLE